MNDINYNFSENVERINVGSIKNNMEADKKKFLE